MVYQEEGSGLNSLNESSLGGQQQGEGKVVQSTLSVFVRGTKEAHKVIRKSLKKRFKILRSFSPSDEELRRYIVFEIASKNGKPINSGTIRHLNRNGSLVVTCREDGSGAFFDPFASRLMD